LEKTIKELNKLCYIILLGSLISLQATCQERTTLEEKKRESLERIKLGKELLEKTREKRENSTFQVRLLNSEIKNRQDLINEYQKEIVDLERDISINESFIEENKNDLNALKSQYARIIRNYYKYIDKEEALMYILSSEDINQGYERIKYIKYLTGYRKSIFRQIEEQTDSLIKLNEYNQLLIMEKENAQSEIENESEQLYKSRRQKNRTIEELKQKESELISEIRTYEATRDRIEKEIRRLIEEERRRAEKLDLTTTLTPEERLISEEFYKNIGGLPWPTVQGVVTGEYGEHPHPVIPGIKVRSNGIDISTVQEMDVRAIFKGEVTVVSAILGANYTVIIKHGNYRSVYQNLVNVTVKPGDNVETKEVIGKVGVNVENESTLHFELWNGMDVVNPKNWLSK